jgi:hypothetical protein
MENLISVVSSVLKTTPSRWVYLTGSLPVDLLSRRPAPAEWSALECLVHIIDVEQVFTTRLQAFLAGRDFAAFNPDAEGTPAAAAPQPAELAARFAEMRQASLAALAALQPADLARQARHAELGLVTLEQMINEWAAHDLNHTIQAERALIQPFIEGCGPWQVYFQDQVVCAA